MGWVGNDPARVLPTRKPILARWRSLAQGRSRFVALCITRAICSRLLTLHKAPLTYIGVGWSRP